MAINRVEGDAVVTAGTTSPRATGRIPRKPLDQITRECAADVVRQIARDADKITVDVARFGSAS